MKHGGIYIIVVLASLASWLTINAAHRVSTGVNTVANQVTQIECPQGLVCRLFEIDTDTVEVQLSGPQGLAAVCRSHKREPFVCRQP